MEKIEERRWKIEALSLEQQVVYNKNAKVGDKVQEVKRHEEDKG